LQDFSHVVEPYPSLQNKSDTQKPGYLKWFVWMFEIGGGVTCAIEVGKGKLKREEAKNVYEQQLGTQP